MKEKLDTICNNKIFKVVKCIVNIIVGGFFVLFLIAVCMQRFSDNKLSIYKYRMFTVASGSMKPLYQIGDVLIAKEVDPKSIEVGDNVSYLGKKGDFKDKVVTHAVVDIEEDENGKRLFHTQGLANLIEDPVVSEEQIYGVIIYKAVLLSFVSRIVATKYGALIFIIIPIFYIIGSELIVMMLEREEKRRNKN